MHLVISPEPLGYRFASEHGTGDAVYRFSPALNTDEDKLAFGFMTWQPNGSLVRIDSDNSADFFEAKLVKMFINHSMHHIHFFRWGPL